MRLHYIMPLLLLLAGCASTPLSPPPAPKEISFTRYQPIALDVGNIEVTEDYKSPMREPNVEHLLPTSPAEAMRLWVKDRLRAAGQKKMLQVIIKDASVVSTPLPKKKDLQGIFTNQQDRRYDAKLDVEMRIYGDQAMSEASIEVSAAQSTTIGEKASLVEREAIFRQLIASLMESINGELEKNIFMYFNRDIMYSHTP